MQAQTAALPLEPASKELVGERQNAVGERLVRLLEPLQERPRLLPPPLPGGCLCSLRDAPKGLHSIHIPWLQPLCTA